MAERRRKIPTRRRGAQPSSFVDLPPRDASIDGWIFDESRRPEFLTPFKEKPLQTPKFINNGWFWNQGFSFPDLFEEQGIRFFTEMQGVYYPDLVRVFHYNLKFRGNIGYTKVKGVEIILDDDIWTNVARIPPSADHTSILYTHIDRFNTILTYSLFYGSLICTSAKSYWLDFVPTWHQSCSIQWSWPTDHLLFNESYYDWLVNVVYGDYA